MVSGVEKNILKSMFAMTESIPPTRLRTVNLHNALAQISVTTSNLTTEYHRYNVYIRLYDTVSKAIMAAEKLCNASAVTNHWTARPGYITPQLLLCSRSARPSITCAHTASPG